MLGFKEFIEDGDSIMLYNGVDEFKPLVVKAGSSYDCANGGFSYNRIIGMRYGSRVYSDATMHRISVNYREYIAKMGGVSMDEQAYIAEQMSKLVYDKQAGFITILYPTPEIWTRALPHRTQILYSADVSMILMELDLKPGSIVAESGTGSASLTHALVRRVCNYTHQLEENEERGCVYTFDFHEDRKLHAERDLTLHFGKFADINGKLPFECQHRDVIGTGFDPLLEHRVDAVFLDLPRPYDMIPEVSRVLKKSGGRVCSFSPCMEQITMTVDNLRKNGFRDIKTIECLLQPHFIRETEVEPFAFSTPSDFKQPLTTNTSDEKPSKVIKLDPRLSDNAASARIKTVTCTRRPEIIAGHTGYLVFATKYAV